MSGTTLSPPKINMGLFKQDPDQLLPGAHDDYPARSMTRRISHTLKARSNRYAVRLTIAFALILLFFVLSAMRSSNNVIAYANRVTANSKALYVREEQEMETADLNGISLLLNEDDEDGFEFLSEEALWMASWDESKSVVAEATKEEKEREAHQADVRKHDLEYSLSALIWYIAEGGVLPHDYAVPTAETLEKIGGRGFERALNKLDSGESIFQEGWADYAQKQYRIVVFSKSYCPYSKRAKAILEKYHLTPAPFIVELDHRSDMDKLQTLLQRFTGRRTVPNVILDFSSLGGADELLMADGEGGLQRQFEEMNVVPGFLRRFAAGQVVNAAPKVAEPALPDYETGSVPLADSNDPAGMNGRQLPGQMDPVAALPRRQQQQQQKALYPDHLAGAQQLRDNDRAPAPHIPKAGSGEPEAMHEQMDALRANQRNDVELDRLRERLKELETLAEVKDKAAVAGRKAGKDAKDSKNDADEAEAEAARDKVAEADLKAAKDGPRPPEVKAKQPQNRGKAKGKGRVVG